MRKLRAKYPACEEEFPLARIPSTRYQGSKRKILRWLFPIFKSLSFDSALDAFGGTGSVSYLLKGMGKAVTYNDVLQFNFLIGLAIIENEDVLLSGDEVNNLLSKPRKCPPGFVTATFRRFYFKDEENKRIDEVAFNARELNDGTKKGALKSALAHYALFQTCLRKRPFNLFHRKNLYIRTARVERNFGNKTTWDRDFDQTFREFTQEVNALIFKGEKRCEAQNKDVFDLSNGYDLVYLDPPYLTPDKNETADYRRCYHFLEGLAQYDNWSSQIDYASPNRRLLPKGENPWIQPKSVTAAFDDLIHHFRKCTIVLSYKKHGTPSLTTLRNLLRRHGKKVEIFTKHYIYALNHQNGDAQFNREALVIAR